MNLHDLAVFFVVVGVYLFGILLIAQFYADIARQIILQVVFLLE